MPRSLRLRDIITANAATRRECADAVRRAQAELAQTRAATRKTIIESRELMARIDVLIAGK